MTLYLFKLVYALVSVRIPYSGTGSVLNLWSDIGFVGCVSYSTVAGSQVTVGRVSRVSRVSRVRVIAYCYHYRFSVH